MGIDPATIARDAQACIADWPALIRHYWDVANNENAFKEIMVGLNSTDDMNVLMAGGLLEEMTITILAMVSDFTVWPRPRDRIDVQIRDGSWVQLEVKRVPDFYDPLLPHIQCILGTPNA